MRDVKKVVFAVVLIIIFALNIGQSGVFVASAFDPGIEEIYSEGVFMVHLDTDIPVFRKNEFARVWPASTTKIMTMLVVLDNVENLNAFVTVTAEMNEGFGKNPNFTDAQAADIQIGQENLTYMDLLYALMIWSACDAANILAYSVGGTVDGFVTMMNQKAAELGCVNTSFGNPHGLHQADNYTCAYDMFLITRYAYDNHTQVFKNIVSAREYRMPANSRHPDGVVLPNTNRMLMRDSSYYYEPAFGVKTGSLPYFYNVDSSERTPGNFSLVSIAERNGHKYMIITLGAPFHDVPNDRGFYTYSDHLALYRWAFASLEYKLVLPEHDIVAQGSVQNGLEDRIQLRPVKDFHYLLPTNLDRNAVHREITMNWHCEEEQVFIAPIERGEILGHVELMMAGEVLTKIDLIATESIEPSLQAQFMDNITGIFSEWWFQTGILLVIVMVVLVVILRIINGQRAKNRRGIAARGRGRRPPRK
jgi:D-alanyl-D-alanine carboxypeptidase (penicillin-binding protein 5/6)